MSEKAKIESLTPEQESKFPLYVAKWLKIGQNTERCDRPLAESIIKEIYEQAKVAFPEGHVSWYQSPLEMIKKNKITDLSFCYGGQETWLSFYSFFLNECNLSECARVEPFIRLAEVARCHWWLPGDTAVYISEPPTSIKMKGNVLHADLAPAVEYSDGFAIYCLNGVCLSKEYVMTPAEKLNVSVVFDESNAEIRRELVRKIGIERVCAGATVIDEKSIVLPVPEMMEPSAESLKAMVENSAERKQNITLKNETIDYALLNLPFRGANRRYLRMNNPSINVYHVEGVAPETNTVDAALLFRNGTSDLPKILS